MRLTSRLYVPVGLGLIGILYFSWSLNLLPVIVLQNSRLESPPYRLVVFGDSWSDDDTIYKPSKQQVWPEMLCSHFPCMLETTAESSDPFFGAIIDNSELEALRINDTASQPADLDSQISEWLDKTKGAFRRVPARQVSAVRQGTIFVVSFGTWDLWKLAEQDLDTATTSAGRIVDKLFAHLSNLAEQWSPNDTKIILSLPVDVTFLPAFRERKGVVQKDAVILAEHWHNLVRNHAEQWQHGSLFLLDTNSFLIDQVRERQLWVGGLIERDEFEKNGVAWENVSEPCVDPTGNSLKQKNCSDPERFLFWDSMHLGPAAQRLLATEVFNAVKELWLN